MKHINTFHLIPSDKSEEEEETETVNKSWTPEPLEFESKISQLIADLRFSTNITGVDLGRFIDSMDNLLSTVVAEVSGKI